MMDLHWRKALRILHAGFAMLEPPWHDLFVAAVVGTASALAVSGFKLALFTLETLLVGAHGGHLVEAARSLPPVTRAIAPATGALAAGLLLWIAERGHPPAPISKTKSGDYIEAVAIGNGHLDIRRGFLKVAASMLIVSTGGAVGREGAMVLLAAMLASILGRMSGHASDLRLVVSCGAAAGLAAAYHAPLASAVFVAEILLGSLALAQLGPVVVAAAVAFGISIVFGESAVLFPVPLIAMPNIAQVMLILTLSLLGGMCGAGLTCWLRAARSVFERSNLSQPLAFAIGGLVVGILSLWRPEVWGNGYSSIQQQLTAPGEGAVITLVLLLKLIAIGASAGSGAPGGVFTPTLFTGAAVGALAAATLAGLGLSSAPEPVYAVVGMAVLLAATTHAPVMSALMIFEMTGEYTLLPLLLPACVLATVVSRQLVPVSIYGLKGPGHIGS